MKFSTKKSIILRIALVGMTFLNFSPAKGFFDTHYVTVKEHKEEHKEKRSFIGFLVQVVCSLVVVPAVHTVVSHLVEKKMLNAVANFTPLTGIQTTFDSVAGVVAAKEDLQELVDFLRNPEKFEQLGAYIPRGILLVGEPGNGKTLLAKAVAGEAKCPFFSVSGSDFVEVYVGTGAARVRELFAKARQYKKPVIIFIDEIDAVGGKRGSAHNDERDQTLNQLLVEMDGFTTSKTPVIVIAATNRIDTLDKALLRPGRFDRHVYVSYPDTKSREMILSLHLKKYTIGSDVDVAALARGTSGFSGADLANFINEAALHAVKHNRLAIINADFEEARDKILVGKESKTMIFSESERKMTAYHEAGHALVQLMMPAITDPLHKITIVPRGNALGVTWSLPLEEKHTHSKEEMEAMLTMLCGGRVAEELVFHTITTGASNDFEKATDLARKMVCSYGMHPDIGAVVYGNRGHSEQTAYNIDNAVKSLVDQALATAKKILQDNRDKLDKLALKLLEEETLSADQVYELLNITPRVNHSF